MEIVPIMQTVRMFRHAYGPGLREFAGDALMLMLASGRHLADAVEEGLWT